MDTSTKCYNIKSKPSYAILKHSRKRSEGPKKECEMYQSKPAALDIYEQPTEVDSNNVATLGNSEWERGQKKIKVREFVQRLEM